ncbi:hypothetical protein RN001_010002 [Aquatica leii]|uniref:Abhydrolase domain-containing protein 16A n=1 Tax=Aquatica leii TaxID=1421715 RepID=A0AAN7P8S4_9COLE|nr:hypothetical protein RN001_010002 [Aquatica leii]
MSAIKSIWDCMFSPRLIKIYGNGPTEKMYDASKLEQWGDKVISSMYMMWKFGVYTSPFLIGILYRKGYLAQDGLLMLSKFATSLGVILVVSFCVRGLGRATNPTYHKFIQTLQSAQIGMVPNVKKELCKYEFEFFAWPVEYSWKDLDGDLSKQRLQISRPLLNRSPFQLFMTIPCQIIGYIAVHTFGIRLIYPGSLSLLQLILETSLLQGRSKLIEANKGVRYKLSTKERNDIDCMFINRRDATPNGNTLVVCCEGNAGFYEIGIMGTVIEGGYSVLGWNHPGFGGSTGTPYPDQEQNAIDIVMQFAINKLDFKIENIILFGWSIGGYSASWAAMNYPDVKGVVLDATFDDILPLAINQMPLWLESVVKLAIREHVNLHNYEQLSKYSGPILLIRRTDDEVISLKEADLSSNRGNHLLIKLMRFRYPYIFEEPQVTLVKDFLATTQGAQDQIMQKIGVNSDLCRSFLESYISENSKSYPMKIGPDMNIQQKNQMALFLVRKHMKDYKSSHCTPLPVEMFQVPWDINVENGFVFT